MTERVYCILTTLSSVIIDGRVIKPSASVFNIGVIVDGLSLSVIPRVNYISKSENFHRYVIIHMRKYYSLNIIKQRI